jgi:hypothetical protein
MPLLECVHLCLFVCACLSVCVCVYPSVPARVCARACATACSCLVYFGFHFFLAAACKYLPGCPDVLDLRLPLRGFPSSTPCVATSCPRPTAALSPGRPRFLPFSAAPPPPLVTLPERGDRRPPARGEVKLPPAVAPARGDMRPFLVRVRVAMVATAAASASACARVVLRPGDCATPLTPSLSPSTAIDVRMGRACE